MRPSTTNTIELFSRKESSDSSSKSYFAVEGIFYTLQGEGLHAGRAAVFCRFAGCNLWNGREDGRAEAVCQFCDTDFVGTNGENGSKYSASDLAAKVADVWRSGTAGVGRRPCLVCTGGEPLLQLNEKLIEEFHKVGFEIAIETNGTIAVPAGVDWVTVSPKANADLVVKKGDELKLVFPQANNVPADFQSLGFDHFFLQPMDGPGADKNISLATKFSMSNPKWRLSLQTHKLPGLQ